MKLGVLAQLQAEKDAELAELADKDLLGNDLEGHPQKGNKYKLGIKKKGPASIMRQALLAGASPEELELLRQLKFVRG